MKFFSRRSSLEVAAAIGNAPARVIGSLGKLGVESRVGVTTARHSYTMGIEVSKWDVRLHDLQRRQLMDQIIASEHIKVVDLQVKYLEYVREHYPELLPNAAAKMGFDLPPEAKDLAEAARAGAPVEDSSVVRHRRVAAVLGATGIHKEMQAV